MSKKHSKWHHNLFNVENIQYSYRNLPTFPKIPSILPPIASTPPPPPFQVLIFAPSPLPKLSPTWQVGEVVGLAPAFPTPHA